MRKSFPMRLCAALLCLMIMMLTGVEALAADESVQVVIPVIATGADCQVALFDEHGNRVQLLNLTADVEDVFVIDLTGLKRFTFTALVYNDHTDTVIFDRRNYRIIIEVVYGADGQPMPLVYIENLISTVGKYGCLEFRNVVIEPITPTPTPTPVVTPTPTPVPTPVPTATPAPYDKLFTFRKVWSGGSEDSIDWVMYNADGTVRHKLFDKKVVTEYEWYYEAYFQDDVSGCYIIEYPVEGYQVIYQNVGIYSDVTDRCYTGGTIINYKLPDTGDATPIANYTALVVVSMLGVCLLVVRYRYVTSKKS